MLFYAIGDFELLFFPLPRLNVDGFRRDVWKLMAIGSVIEQ